MQFLIPCPVLMAVGLRLPPLALPVEPKRSTPDACLSFYSLAPESYQRAQGLTSMIQGWEQSEVMRPVSARRRFQALHAASATAS